MFRTANASYCLSQVTIKSFFVDLFNKSKFNINDECVNNFERRDFNRYLTFSIF